MDHCALDHPLEAGGRFGVLPIVNHQGPEFIVHIVGQGDFKRAEVDVAGLHHPDRVLIIDQGEQQMLKCGVFVLSLGGESDGAMERVFELARE